MSVTIQLWPSNKKDQDVSGITDQMQCNRDIFISKHDMQEWWENLLITPNKKIFSFYNWYQCYLELELLPLRFQQTPSQFHINHVNWFQPQLYNQTPELMWPRLLFLWVWNRILPGLYAKKAGKTLISDANSLWQASDNRQFI